MNSSMTRAPAAFSPARSDARVEEQHDTSDAAQRSIVPAASVDAGMSTPSDAVQQAPHPFVRLPDELQLRVLAHLSKRTLARIESVTRRWQALVLDPSLYLRSHKAFVALATADCVASGPHAQVVRVTDVVATHLRDVGPRLFLADAKWWAGKVYQQEFVEEDYTYNHLFRTQYFAAAINAAVETFVPGFTNLDRLSSRAAATRYLTDFVGRRRVDDAQVETFAAMWHASPKRLGVKLDVLLNDGAQALRAMFAYHPKMEDWARRQRKDGREFIFSFCKLPPESCAGYTWPKFVYDPAELTLPQQALWHELCGSEFVAKIWRGVFAQDYSPTPDRLRTQSILGFRGARDVADDLVAPLVALLGDKRHQRLLYRFVCESEPTYGSDLYSKAGRIRATS